MGGSALEMIVSEMPVHPRRTQDPAIFPGQNYRRLMKVHSLVPRRPIVIRSRKQLARFAMKEPHA